MAGRKKLSSRRKGSAPGEERRFRSSLAARLVYGVIVLLLCLNGFFLFSFVERLRGDGSSPERDRRKPDGQVVTDRHEFKVEVLNGAGVSGIARTMTDYLREEGFDVINYGNAEDFSFYETMVLDRTGGREPAHQVARSIGARAVLEQTNPFLALDVTVILGRDYPRLIPFTLGGEHE